jgi:hypothetical protein
MSDINKISDAFKSISSSKSELEFLSIFDTTSNIDESISSGYTDLMYRVLTPDLLKSIGNPSQVDCCEIGFGAGRLLLPASFIFRHVHGIDIHENFDRVSNRIKSFNRNNFTLHKSENAESNIPEKSIKFAFSFITFQHFESWEIAEFYLDLLHKKLADDGCGIIFFGRNNLNDQDCFIPNHQSFDDFPITMFVKDSFAKREISKKFEVIEVGVINKRPWLSESSKQFYVKFKK